MLKCCGSRGAGTSTPLSTATKASTEQKGSHFNKSASVSLRRCLFFNIWSSPPPAAPPPPANADRLRKQVGRTRRAQRLHDDSRQHGLSYSPKGSCNEGERLCVPQVRGEVRPALRAGGGHPRGEPGVDPGRGSTRENVIFSNSLWTNSEYPNLLKNIYGPCKFSLKKNDPFLTYKPPKVSVFL